MADLYLVIQSIMKFQKAMKKVDVLLKNSEKYTGIIKKFSGKQLLLEEMEINIDDIDLVEEHVELDLSVFIMNRVLITLDTAERVDAVLMSVDSEEISYITEDGLKTVEIERIAKILCEEQEVILKDIAIEENIPSIEKETTLGENEVICQEETSEIENGIYEPNAFEQGLIDGNKALVESYVEQSERLLSCGYTEKEVERIKKRYKILAWSMEPFKVATRIYEMQLNKNGLARQYYEIALEKSKIGSPEFVKTVNALVKLIVEDGDEQYVAFWKKYAMYLKDNVGYCNKFLETLLRLKKIKPNEFERLLIKGDKAAVMEYSGNEEALLDLEYTTDDIERILKALKIANWDNSWYRIAARLFCMQLNKNGLAEVYYEAALLVANEKGDEYTKILNALASVKALQNNDEYISFFDAYQEKLKSNANFCIAYANALLATQNLEKLEEKVPMLKEQLAGNPAYLGKLDAEINYYKTMPRFVLANIKVLSDRYENEAVHYEQEKALIEKLPERSALNTLLEIYFFNKEEAAYFALVEYALFFMKENKTAMLKLYTMLHATEDVGTIAHLLPKIPVLWCDADLVKKYMSVVTEEEDFSSTDINRQRLRQHIVSVGVYRTLNAFEIGIVNCDCNEVSRYSDDVSLLEELGYSDDEIEDISSVDVEAQLSGDIYAMRRILAFQGNKNHTAEKYLFEAFYNNKIDMCNRLFPLLLEEKRGELILGLFDFDPNLNSKMTSLQRFYYLALCIAEKDDSLFFDRMESEWMNFPEDEILDRMLKIAMEKGDELLIKQLELQKNRPRANEFETAIMEADSEAIRKFVKNANLLVELGYTPEEIQKISKIFEIGNTNSGTKPGQIANRVYLYQKNKNNLAERLYLNAIAEDSSEDVITDCKALFQIYTGQHNYEMVCKIYENYLYAEMEEKFNRTYAATYCVALYELNRFEEFLAYFEENRERWENFSLTANLLYVCEMMNVHDYDDYIWENIKTTTYRPDIVVKYILLVAEKDVENSYTESFIKLFNMFFLNFSEEEIFKLIEILKNAIPSRYRLPEAGILAAFASEENQVEYFITWLEYVQSSVEVNHRIDILIKLSKIFQEEKGVLVEKALAFFELWQNEVISEYKMSELEDFIYKNVSGQEQKNKWIEIQENNFREGKGNIHSLENYLEAVTKLELPDKFWEVYLLYKKTCEVEVQSQLLYDIVWKFYDSSQSEMSKIIKDEVVEEIIFLSGGVNLDYVGCKNMADICQSLGKNFEAKIYMLAAGKAMRQNRDEDSTYEEAVEEKEVEYYEYLCTILRNDDGYVDFSEKCIGWSKYISLSEEEELVIERLRNTIKTAELWVTEELNVLSKAIICEPENTVYWKLFQTWITQGQDKDEVILGSILYQISSKGNKEIEYALNYAVANNLKQMALELILKMLDSPIPALNIAAQKNVRLMIGKGWFEEAFFAGKAADIIRKIGVNTNLTDVVNYEWNSVSAAVDLTIATAEYGVFIDAFSDYLSKNCAKQCCVIIAAMILDDHREYLVDAFECLNYSFADVPYKELVSDMYTISITRELTVAEKMALRCIQADYGNALGVNHLLEFYCDMCMQEQRKCGLETLKILMEYTPYDPVLFEVAACFLKDETGIDRSVQFYEYMFDYLEFSKSENPIEYAIGQMVCGENYLRLNGKDVKSFKKMIEERYPRYVDVVRNYQEFCDCVVVSLRTTECEEFAKILFRAVFFGNWLEVFEYKPGDNIVETVLKNNIKTDRLNIADCYYRSIIKSVALFILNHRSNMWDIIDNSQRIRMFWSNMGNVGCDFDYFSEVLQSVDEEYISELYHIWSLDIETLTVFKKFFGRCILEQPHCEEYAPIFNVFINAKGGDIFNSENIEIQKVLSSMDKERAIKVCTVFEALYIHPSGPVVLYSTGKSMIVDSDYETNLFSVYLKRNTKDFYTLEKRYERFKKKYEEICRLYHVDSFEEANSQRFELNVKRLIFSVRSLYFFYSVLLNQIDEKEFGGHRQTEIINAITVVLSDDTYMSDLNTFISKFGAEERVALGILIMAEQDQLDNAANMAMARISGKWRAYLCARLVASYGMNGKRNELCKKCLGIFKSAALDNCYWIKNYKHGKTIGKLNPEMYLEDLNLQEGNEEDKIEENTDGSEIIIQEQESVYEKIIVTTEQTEISETMNADIPSFIQDFLNMNCEEKKLEELQDQWNALKDAVDNGRESQDSLNELSIRIGIHLIKRNSTFVDEQIMSEVFCLVKRYSIQDSYLITALHDLLQNYIGSYTNLDQLAASVYEHRAAMGHLCLEQSMKQKSRIAQDIEAATVLIEILIDIANDLSSAMGEEAIKERLKAYQDELFKKTKMISKFRNAVNALGKMIQEKINSINYVPYLVISHKTSVSTDSTKNYNWNETWLEGAEKGTVRGLVVNRGGAPALKVLLNVMINSELRCTYTIEKIAPGRKIPFVVSYFRDDVSEGIVSWSANVTYFDESNDKSRTSNGYGEIAVTFSDEEWGIEHVGREKFNTQFAAEGEEFCGRTNELLKLNNLYSVNYPAERYPSLLVTGLRRAGKSSVIKYFKEVLRERTNLAPIFIDAQGIAGDITNAFFNLVFNELYRYYRAEMNGFVEFKKRWEDISKTKDWIGQLPAYFIELSELLGNRKVVFVLDEMENVFYANHFESAQSEEQFFGMIRSIIQNYQEYVSFIFCGSDKLLTSCLEQKRESQMFQVLQRIYVGRMNINDIRDMFEKYNSVYDVKFGDDAIDTIMYYTNGLIWYTKVIAYNILDRIVDQEHIIRDEIHASDVDTIVELLINGDLGSELIDLLDNNFGAKRKAIIRAMARATKNPNDSVSIDMILAELTKLNYVDNETGEVLGAISDDDISKNLSVLEKMDFIEKDSHKEKSYRFTTELYRLLMLNERKIDKFVVVMGGEKNAR